MTDGSVRASASVQVRGTLAPQGTATTSTVNDLKTQDSGAAEFALAFGTASAQADIICAQDRTLTGSGGATPAETLDLYTGTDLKDLFGATAALRKIKFVMVYVVTGGDALGVAIGGAASNANALFFADATDKHKVFPSGPAYQAGSPAGVTVDATHKALKIENLSSVSVTYRIVVAGTSV